ncbi:MAG: hypothetical protein EOP35_06600 [Rubrivivax sp.]|nr:MAG: hypothetical protein EOP35_06600 [Rubrivivax sp.]
MSNPWLKKNPFMSMWLSAANSAAGTARGHATAAVKRQSQATVTQATNDVMNFWAGALGTAPKARAKRKTRR